MKMLTVKEAEKKLKRWTISSKQQFYTKWR